MTALVETLEADAAMVHLVHVEVPGRRTRSRLLALEQRLTSLLEAYLAGSGLRAESGPGAQPPPAAVAWVMVQATEQIVMRWVVDRHEGVRDQAGQLSREQVIDEVTALSTSYLAHRAASRGK